MKNNNIYILASIFDNAKSFYNKAYFTREDLKGKKALLENENKILLYYIGAEGFKER